jgi:hypothetical protein
MKKQRFGSPFTSSNQSLPANRTHHLESVDIEMVKRSDPTRISEIDNTVHPLNGELRTILINDAVTNTS